MTQQAPVTDHHAEAERLLDEAGGLPPGDEATSTFLKAAHVHAMLAIADKLAIIVRKIDDVTDGQGSINTWPMRGG